MEIGGPFFDKRKRIIANGSSQRNATAAVSVFESRPSRGRPVAVGRRSMSYKYSVQNYDNWLERGLADRRSCPGVALDVGCGPGIDTQFLVARGFDVHACDISE